MPLWRFAECTWTEVEEAVKAGALCLLPFGQVEEHGKHLPLKTDWRIAEEVAERAARAVEEEIPVVLLPCVWTGYTGEALRRWPGTISLRPETFLDLACDLLESLVRMGFRKIVIVNCHGHNQELLCLAARKILDAHPRVMVAVTNPLQIAREELRKLRRSEIGGISHAGEFETAVMMALGERVVREEFTDRDRIRYRSEFVGGDGLEGSKVFWSTWTYAHSEAGGLGDPTVAEPETGEKMLRAIASAYKRFLLEFFRFHKD